MRSIVLLSIASSLCACAPAHVYTRALDDAAIHEARTFAFAATESAPPGYRRTRLTDEVLAIVDGTTANVLAERGYRIATPDTADLLVRIGAGARVVGAVAAARMDTHGSPGGVIDPDGPFNYSEGSVVVDVFDRGGHRLWHGSAFQLIHAGRLDRQRIARVVERLLSTFPSVK